MLRLQERGDKKQRATIKDLKVVGVNRVNFIVWLSDFLEIRVRIESVSTVTMKGLTVFAALFFLAIALHIGIAAPYFDDKERGTIVKSLCTISPCHWQCFYFFH